VIDVQRGLVVTGEGGETPRAHVVRLRDFLKEGKGRLGKRSEGCGLA
jgi:hypothetical protein